MLPDDPRHGTYSGAQQHYRDGEAFCEPCRLSHRAYQRSIDFDKANGRARRVSTADVRAHLRHLVDHGVPIRAIAERSGVSRGTIQDLLTRPRAMMRADNAEALLQTHPAAERTGLVSSVGTLRRIRSLQALGWSMPRMVATARRIDPTAELTYSGLRQITYETPAAVRVRTAQAVAAAYAELSMRTPASDRQSAQVRNRALRKGWVPPLAWDDIDDPDEQPNLDRPCNEDGCAGRVVARGLCSTHYQREKYAS